MPMMNARITTRLKTLTAPGKISDQQQLAIDRQLHLQRGRGVVVRGVRGENLLPQRDHGRAIVERAVPGGTGNGAVTLNRGTAEDAGQFWNLFDPPPGELQAIAQR